MLSNDFTQMSSILLTTSQIRKLKKIVIKFWLLHFCLTNYDRNIYSESTCLGRLKQCSLIDKWIIPTWLTNQIQAMILICKKYACEFTGTGLMILRKYFLLVLNLFIVNKLALKQESEVLTGWILLFIIKIEIDWCTSIDKNWMGASITSTCHQIGWQFG